MTNAPSQRRATSAAPPQDDHVAPLPRRVDAILEKRHLVQTGLVLGPQPPKVEDNVRVARIHPEVIEGGDQPVRERPATHVVGITDAVADGHSAAVVSRRSSDDVGCASSPIE